MTRSENDAEKLQEITTLFAAAAELARLREVNAHKEQRIVELVAALEQANRALNRARAWNANEIARLLTDEVLHEAQTAQRVAFETAKSDHRKTSLDAMRHVVLDAVTGAGEETP